MEKREIKKFLLRAIIFVCPLCLFVILELFVLPIDFFTFRAWEAVLPRGVAFCLPGPFYPRIKADFIEQGDLAFRTAHAVPKVTRWETDRFGYRNRPDKLDRPVDVVIVGDSNAVGSGSTQGDTLSEQIEKIVPGLNVYTYAPASMTQFLSDAWFMNESRPKLVIFEKIERDLFRDVADLPPPFPAKPKRFALKIGPVKTKIYHKRLSGSSVQSGLVLSNRLLEPSSFQYIQSRIRTFQIAAPAYTNIKGVFFLQGQPGVVNVPEEKIVQLASTLASYQARLEGYGMKFLFLPVPNKESYYYDNWAASPPNLLPELTKHLKSRKVANIDVLTKFLEYKRGGQRGSPYHSDDTHWNALGQKIASEAVREWLIADN